MFSSFKAGYIKTIDLTLYNSLKSAVARRLYRYLDKKFYRTPVIKKPLLMLAFEKIGIARTCKYISSVKQQLLPACEELVEKGYLESFEFSGCNPEPMVTFTKKSLVVDDTKIIAWKNLQERNGQVIDIASLPVVPTPEMLEVQTMLTERGLALAQVRKLLKVKTAEQLKRVREIVQYFDDLVASNSSKTLQSKEGFLYRAVERSDTFTLPSDFKSQKQGSFYKPVAQQSIFENSANKKAELFKRSAYEQYRKKMIESYKATLTENNIRDLQIIAEQKVRGFTKELDENSITNACNGLINKELATRAAVLNFEDWEKALGCNI